MHNNVIKESIICILILHNRFDTRKLENIQVTEFYDGYDDERIEGIFCSAFYESSSSSSSC